jgi:hypothetical protein
VLDAIAATLQLDPMERAHLYTLTGAGEPLVDKQCRAISAPTHLMLRQLEPYPASVQNSRTDLLAFNRSYDLLLGISELPHENRNILLLAFTSAAFRKCIVDWEDSAPRMVAQFRGAMASHVAEPAWKLLVKRLRRESEEFDALWQQHEIRSPENFTKRFLHPKVGLMRFEHTHLWLGPRSELIMKTYTPVDDETLGKLQTMHELAA